MGRRTNHRHLLTSVVSAFILFVAVPPAMASPGGGSAQAVPAPANTASAAGTPPTSVTPAAPEPPSTPPATSTTDTAPQVPAATTDPSPSTAGTPSQPAPPGLDQPPSSSTAQTVAQIQNLGCTAHCRGTSQTQSAQQVNLTVQPASGSSGGVSPSGAALEGSGHQTKLIQVQLGCLAHCFGATTTGNTGAPGASVLPQLPATGTGQGGVQQSSLQVQDGGPETSSQSQSAVQTNTLVQGLLPGLDFRSPPADLSALPNWIAATDIGSPPASGPVIHQLEQVIWQLQVGCLLDCTQTVQTQHAEQSDITLNVLPAAPAAGSTTADSSPITESVQLVWQVQVGCLYWCYDAVETQTASILSTVETLFVPSSGDGDSTSSGVIGPARSGGPQLGSSALVGTAPAGGRESLLMTIGPPVLGLVTARPVAGVAILSPAMASAPAPHRTQMLSAPLFPVMARRPAGSSVPTARLALRFAPLPHRVSLTHPRDRLQAKALKQRHEAHGLSRSFPTPPELLGSPSSTSWGFLTFVAAAALIVAALIASELEARRSRRLNPPRT
jgi:hypothetical protein